MSETNLPAPQAPSDAQPGGHGFFTRCEIAWGRVRRWFLRTFRPGYVAACRSQRIGEDQRFDAEVIDSRDLKYIGPGCGIRFRRETDPFARREHYGFARWGYAELIGYGSLGLALLGGFAFLAGSVHAVFLLPAVAAFLAIVEVLWFFRDPPRMPPTDTAALASPADGTVTHVETIADPDFAGPVLRVSIFLSIFNVHVNRAPRSGRVTAVRYFRGAFLDARHADCARRNEQLWLDLADSATGAPIRVKQISGAIARRIVCTVRAGDDLRIGDRYGMIKFGSRTDVLIPAERVAEVLVAVGDKVRGASTTLLRIKPG